MPARPSGMTCQVGQLGGAPDGAGWYSGLFDCCAHAVGKHTPLARAITPVQTYARICNMGTLLVDISGFDITLPQAKAILLSHSWQPLRAQV